jgi:hypothetical protein
MAKRTQRARKKPAGSPSTQGNGTVKVSDAELVFEITGGKYDGQTIKMDPTLVNQLALRLERSHELAKDEKDMIVATPKFLQELDKGLQELGYDSTPAIAGAAWASAREWENGLQKKTSA